MILEIADIRIPPGQQAAFDEAIQRGIATVASKAKGFRGFKVNKGIESPERYVLMIFWDTLEDHTVEEAHNAAKMVHKAVREVIGPRTKAQVTFRAGPVTPVAETVDAHA